MSKSKYKRVLLKLSGEAFSGGEAFGIDGFLDPASSVINRASEGDDGVGGNKDGR